MNVKFGPKYDYYDYICCYFTFAVFFCTHFYPFLFTDLHYKCTWIIFACTVICKGLWKRWVFGDNKPLSPKHHAQRKGEQSL